MGCTLGSHLLALAAAGFILGGGGGGNTLDGLYSRRAWAVNEVLALRAINPSFALVPASAGMLTYADVCRRMLTYADVCYRINPSFALVPASAGMLTYADVC